jgi:hypothetical protein
LKALPVENLTVIAAAISTASPVKAREAIVKQRANSSAVSDRSVVRRSRVGSGSNFRGRREAQGDAPGDARCKYAISIS